MKLLVTGFDPFGGESINPAIESVKRLPDVILGCEIIKLEVPTVFHQSLAVIEEAIIKYNPDVILSIGQAGGRADITVERIGINLDDGRIPDNQGNKPIDMPIYKDGPDAYFVNVPIKAMVAYIRKEGIPASISNTAGTYVCNHVCYGVSHLVHTKYPGKRSGFIHIPFLPSQVAGKGSYPSMNLDTIVLGIEAAIKAIIENKKDIVVSEGTTH